MTSNPGNPTPDQIKSRYTPHKILRENSVFVAIGDDSSIVLEVRPTILKVSKLLDSAGNPIRGPDGNPSYTVQTNVQIVTLTNDEWNIRKRLDDFQ